MFAVRHKIKEKCPPRFFEQAFKILLFGLFDER